MSPTNPHSPPCFPHASSRWPLLRRVLSSQAPARPGTRAPPLPALRERGGWPCRAVPGRSSRLGGAGGWAGLAPVRWRSMLADRADRAGHGGGDFLCTCSVGRSRVGVLRRPRTGVSSAVVCVVTTQVGRSRTVAEWTGVDTRRLSSPAVERQPDSVVIGRLSGGGEGGFGAEGFEDFYFSVDVSAFGL